MSVNSITNAQATGYEIAAIITAIVEATQAHSDEALVLGCIATALTVCNPAISKDKLAEGVKHVSEHMALWVATSDEGLKVN